MPFLYKFVIDNKEVDVEMGFTTSRKWEEALDEASLVVPFSIENKDPEKMFSLLEVEIIEIDNYIDRNIVEIKNKEYLIFSDKVENVGNYGYYKHNLSGIEYTAKLDVYFINQLAKSRSILTNQLAPFEHNNRQVIIPTSKAYMPKGILTNLNIKKMLKSNQATTFNKVPKAYVIDVEKSTSTHLYWVERDVAIRTNAIQSTMDNPHILSNEDVSWNFPKGKWEIEYGFIGLEEDVSQIFGFEEGFNNLYTFFVEVGYGDDLTMYDVVNEIRDMISKFGGLEDTIYYDSTRVFNIDDEFKELLKNTQAPQIYLNTATARQMLIYVLSFVNALPRLKYGSSIDTLTLEQYNLDTGNFVIEDIVGRGSQQNTNQIGTRNYQAITQGLSSDLDDPSIVTPSHSQVQTVRAVETQITDVGFGFKLPDKAPLYIPIKLVAQIPNFNVVGVAGNVEYPIIDIDNFELDLTSRFINSEEWKMKKVTSNFPYAVKYYVLNDPIGLRENKVENLEWNIGDTIIKLADNYGTLIKVNLVENVVESAIMEYLSLNFFTPMTYDPIEDGDDYAHFDYFKFDYTLPNHYKNWKFRLEYISDERLVIKQDKEDISQIDFYSEMRQNQEESLVNIVRQSKKAYGDLQRTGNIFPLFTKKHESLSEFYKEGQKDKNGFTITQVDTQWFNDYALATYYVTKHHNRIQQATFINQAYRPFDNFTKNALNRHEYYGDYLIVVPPNYENLIQEPTKIYSNDRTIRQISNILLGKKPKLNSSVSTALIRTDGMLEENPDNNGKINFISTPVTSRGIKGGFTFTFGFESNMVAGDGLVADGSNYYNQAVRYTDTSGRFSRFGFNLLNKLEYENSGEMEYEKYPLVTYSENYANNDLLNDTYIWCGNPSSESGYDYPLVWNKDPLTNTNLTYGINILSYNTNQYIFGSKFFTDNFLVRTHTKDEIDNYETPILYRYQYGSDVKYNMFDDLYVKKPNIATPITLSSTYVEFDSETNEIKFKNISFSATNSWAIGIPRKNSDVVDLLVACNEGINGLKFVEKHFRPNVREIGKKKVVTIETIEKSFCDEITYKITNTTNQKVSVYVNLISIGYLEIGESILRTTSHNLSGIGGEINKFIVFVGLNDLETTEYSYTEIIPKECIIK